MEEKDYIYILFEGQEDNSEGELKPAGCEIVGAFKSEEDLIKYVRNVVIDAVDSTNENRDYIRIPTKDEFKPWTKIYFAHGYCKPIKRYFEYEVCELK